MPVLPGAEPFSADGGDRAVLLCHGFTGSPQGLRPWAQDLADAGLTVRLPRLPGHGTTWQEMARTGWDDWVAAVAAELAALRARGCTTVVGGLSMGGALALRLAADHPGDVAGLVLVNPSVRQGARERLAVPVLRRLVASAPGVGGDLRVRDVAELAYDRVPLGSLHTFQRASRELVRDLHRVVAPLVLLRSAVDHVVPPSSSALVLSSVSSTDVREHVLADSYHVATLDHDAPAISATTLDLVRRVAP
ncbi:carboxylesterase [Quadrisphaera sp. DSM 44207]|uniref:alpha/beta hydrolase n=1 Tax=Quadrisphaera sp. DSM 44207 TaxID=1881057 RepID=UPI00088BBCA6|nr:alpha/beta fold hydrolase [Quadrisphaera sp. DSM 44207]SDQ33420.1 carboxylesterase [Quadrisphaera sp. DSM 44207]